MAEDPGRPAAVTWSAPAKINLALHVTGRRAYGYHELDTLVVFADCGERVSVSPASDVTLAICGPFAAHAPAGQANLAFRAALELRKAVGTSGGAAAGAAIRLEKHLPAGAGLGGGSADAAATLHALNILWQTGLNDRTLAELGACLGADVAMCVHSRALRAGGIGEIIEPFSTLPRLPLVLLWPGKPASTASLFKQLRDVSNTALPTPPNACSTMEDLVDYLAHTRNDLQETAIEAEPAIAEALSALRETDQCLLWRMSGSGSACFGIYPDRAHAHAASQVLVSRHKDWWVRAVRTR